VNSKRTSINKKENINGESKTQINRTNFNLIFRSKRKILTHNLGLFFCRKKEQDCYKTLLKFNVEDVFRFVSVGEARAFYRKEVHPLNFFYWDIPFPQQRVFQKCSLKDVGNYIFEPEVEIKRSENFTLEFLDLFISSFFKGKKLTLFTIVFSKNY